MGPGRTGRGGVIRGGGVGKGTQCSCSCVGHAAWTPAGSGDGEDASENTCEDRQDWVFDLLVEVGVEGCMGHGGRREVRQRFLTWKLMYDGANTHEWNLGCASPESDYGQGLGHWISVQLTSHVQPKTLLPVLQRNEKPLDGRPILFPMPEAHTCLHPACAHLLSGSLGFGKT